MDDEIKITRNDVLRIVWMTALLFVMIGVAYWLDAQYDVLAQVESQFTNVGL